MIFAVMALYFVGGYFAFPNAPYRHCVGGYCDKLGGSHTLTEYHHQKMWEAGLVTLWVAGILTLYLINRKTGALS